MDPLHQKRREILRALSNKTDSLPLSFWQYQSVLFPPSASFWHFSTTDCKQCFFITAKRQSCLSLVFILSKLKFCLLRVHIVESFVSCSISSTLFEGFFFVDFICGLLLKTLSLIFLQKSQIIWVLAGVKAMKRSWSMAKVWFSQVGRFWMLLTKQCKVFC